jgi:hypothetical protein
MAWSETYLMCFNSFKDSTPFFSYGSFIVISINNNWHVQKNILTEFNFKLWMGIHGSSK